MTKVISGTGLAQLIAALATLYVTHHIDPADWGIYGAIMAVSQFVIPAAALRYDMAIVLPKDDDDAVRLLVLALGFNTLLLAVLSVPLWLENGWLSGHLAAPELAPWLPLLPLGVWLAANNQIWTNWNNRQRRYSLNAQGRVGQSLAMSLVQLGGGFAKLGTLGLIAGLWAEKFDQLAAFQNFLIVPMTFLAGVFYSVHSLPPFWQAASHFNPFFYLVDGFRHGFFGISDVSPWMSLGIVGAAFLAVSAGALALLKSGYKLRS